MEDGTLKVVFHNASTMFFDQNIAGRLLAAFEEALTIQQGILARASE